MKEETIQWEKTLCLYFAKRELGETLLKKTKRQVQAVLLFILNPQLLNGTVLFQLIKNR